MDRETISRLEALSKVALAPDERERLVRDLARIVAYAAELRALRAEGGDRETVGGSLVEKGEGLAVETGSAAGSGLRDDVPGISLRRETVLEGAPDTEEGGRFYRVPRVIPR